VLSADVFLKLKIHLYGAAVVFKAYVVGEGLHDVYASASTTFDILRAGGIGQFIGIESVSFVGNTKGNTPVFFLGVDVYKLGFVTFVAMYDGVIDSFGKADQDVTILVRVKAKIIFQFFKVRFDFEDVVGVG